MSLLTLSSDACFLYNCRAKWFASLVSGSTTSIFFPHIGQNGVVLNSPQHNKSFDRSGLPSTPVPKGLSPFIVFPPPGQFGRYLSPTTRTMISFGLDFGGGGGGAGRRRSISARSGQPGGLAYPSPPQSLHGAVFQNCHQRRCGSGTCPCFSVFPKHDLHQLMPIVR